MDNAARTRQRVLAIFLPVTAVLYIGGEALSPKGTDEVIATTATALKVLPIAARHPAQLGQCHKTLQAAGQSVAWALFGLGSRPVRLAPLTRLDLPPGTEARANTEGDEHVSSPADHTTRASHSTSVSLAQTPSHLSRHEGRTGYNVAGGGSLVGLVPGLGDVRAGRGLQQAENVVALVRRDVVACHGPRVLAVLNTVSTAGNWPRAQGLASMGEVSR